MAESFDLTTPITQPSRTSYRVQRLILDWGASTIGVELVGSDGTIVVTGYTNSVAATLMTGLNTANLTTNSLHKRVLQRLQQDGLLPAGTITGTPA